MSTQQTIGDETGHVRELYHYSETDIDGPIRPNQYWTSFKSDNPQDVSRVTGTQATRLNYRSVALVNDEKIDGPNAWFLNRATKFAEGLGAYDEYTNSQPIHPKHLVTVKIAT